MIKYILIFIFFTISKIVFSNELKSFNIYDNFPYNWTLFGTKLYDKVENVNAIGKFDFLDIKDSSGNVNYKCVGALSFDGKPLTIKSVTDNDGCIINNNIDYGLGDFAIGIYNEHYIINPKNYNEYFSIYIVRYSPLEKRILSITAKKRVAHDSEEVCDDEGKIIIESIYKDLSKQNNFIIDIVSTNPEPYIALGYDYNTAYQYTEEQLAEKIGAAYAYSCIDDQYSKDHLYIYLTDTWRDFKISRELLIMEENEILKEKTNNQKNIGKALKNGVL